MPLPDQLVALFPYTSIMFRKSEDVDGYTSSVRCLPGRGERVGRRHAGCAGAGGARRVPREFQRVVPGEPLPGDFPVKVAP